MIKEQVPLALDINLIELLQMAAGSLEKQRQYAPSGMTIRWLSVQHKRNIFSWILLRFNSISTHFTYSFVSLAVIKHRILFMTSTVFSNLQSMFEIFMSVVEAWISLVGRVKKDDKFKSSHRRVARVEVVEEWNTIMTSCISETKKNIMY